MGLFSNLNLNGQTSPRVQPGIGGWGPDGVRSTRMKKVWRVLWWLLWVLAVALVVGLGTFIYFQMKKGGA